NILDLQAGYSTAVAHMVYGRELQLSLFEIAIRRNRFRRASIQWHRFLGFQSHSASTVLFKRKREVFEKE
ncbi:hypothetical protein M406DRAFT_227584, partial [Cryphonectria parasitica EP155]